MTDELAIKATFVDIRSVKTRSQTQLIFEIPIEQTDAALKALGGYPQPQEGKWVAIARINEMAARAEPEKPKRPPATTRAEKARRLCGVPEFWDFIEPKVRQEGSVRFEGKDRYEVTSNYVKWYCGVTTKAQLDSFENASGSHNPAACWDMLLDDFEQATGRRAERM